MKLFTIVFLVSALAVTGFAQDKTKNASDFHIVFEEIQHGFEIGSVAALSPYFSTHVQLSLRGSDNGYYSSNHAFYLLESYFKTRKVISFEFSSVGETDTTPFATGTAVFMTQGMRETVQVYVALAKANGRWMITEINIY